MTSRLLTEKELGCTNKERFVIELEFIQCLANPQYLNCTFSDATIDATKDIAE